MIKRNGVISDMLEEYLTENLRESREKLEKEKRKLCECRDMEQTIQREIQEIQNNTDIDFEIFSPRATDKSLKGKMNQLCGNMQILRESIEKLERNIEKYEKREKEFSIMEGELEKLKKQAHVSRETYGN